MRKLLVLAITAALVLAWGQVASASSRFGPTDLMYVPTSGTLAEGAFGVYGSFTSYDTFLGMDVGLIPHLELGIYAWLWDGGEEAAVRCKYHLLTERQHGFGLAIGLQDLGQSEMTPYLVAGKSLAPTLQGYLGVGGGWMDGIFFGLNWQPRAIKDTSFFVEYDSYNINAGARFKLSGGIGVDVGLADLEEVAVGVSYIGRF